MSQGYDTEAPVPTLMTSKSRPRIRRGRLALLAALLVCVVAGGAIELEVTSAQAQSGYAAARDRLDGDLNAARTLGYTELELAPVPASADRLETVDPIWVSGRPGYYQSRAASLTALDRQLGSLEVAALAQRRRLATAAVQTAAAGVSQATQLGADPFDLANLHSQLAAAEDAELAATGPRQLDAVAAAARAVAHSAQALSQTQAADLAAIQAAAPALKAADGADPARLRRDGQKSLAAGRNDATVAAYLRLTAVTRPYDQLERYGATLQQAGTDPDQLALAAAGLQHYQQAIHSSLLGALPHQAIIVSHQAQELWAYEDGKLVRDTLVTTGRPELPTDIGAMKVLSKSSPFTMRSPWPKSSQWYYPPTKVQMVLWFTITGEGLHDAYWEPDWAYGAGSETEGYASHGCIHVPLADETWLFNWAKIGTPVIVYPGDGSTVVNQVSQISVTVNGDPTTGPKGA